MKKLILSALAILTLAACTQKPADIAPLTYTPKEISVSADGGPFTIKVTYSGDYHLDVQNPDWITVSRTEGDPKSGCVHYFMAKANTGNARTGVITVCDESNCFPVVVSQPMGASAKTVSHHSLGMRFTATWCGYCPMMNDAFASVKSSIGNKFEIVNIHDLSSDLAFKDSQALLGKYSITGFPTGIVDGRKQIDNQSVVANTAAAVKEAVAETESTYPAMTSAGISSTLSDRHLDVKVKVFVRQSGDYKITALLLEDGIVHAQADYVNGAQDKYIHNHTARMTLTDSVLGDDFTAEVESTTEFNYSAEIPEQYDASKMSVLVYIQNTFGNKKKIQSGNFGDWYIDNCRSAAVGTSVEPEVK